MAPDIIEANTELDSPGQSELLTRRRKIKIAVARRRKIKIAVRKKREEITENGETLEFWSFSNLSLEKEGVVL